MAGLVIKGLGGLWGVGHFDKIYYPALLNGMRGSHKGSFEVAHALVMQGQRPGEYERIDDEYDLVVVGGGISGLAAAYLYRKQKGPGAKILVLDNHDDFGGHKQSGLGCENSLHGLMEYTNWQTITLNKSDG